MIVRKLILFTVVWHIYVALTYVNLWGCHSIISYVP